jgi:signal transduction histidine kinase
MAGVGFGDPTVGAVAGVAVGATVGAVAEEMVGVVARMWSNRQRRVEDFAATLAHEANAPVEAVLQQVADSPRALELLAQTVDAASRAADDWKIDALARVFAHSIQNDGAAVDDGLLLIDALRQLEVPHLRLLRILGTTRVDTARTDGGTTYPFRMPLLRASQIVGLDPGLDGALEALAAKLVTLGMAVRHEVDDSKRVLPNADRHRHAWSLTRFGFDCAVYLVGRGERARHGTL